MARVAPDSNDVLVYLLNDGPTTFANTGTQGSSANWTSYGNPISSAPGIIKDPNGNFNALYIPGSGISSNHDGAGGANDVIFTPTISLSGWVFLRKYTNYFAELFNKQYFLNGWSNPWLTFGFQLLNSNDGQLDLYVTLNGTLQFIRTPFNFYMPCQRWVHLGGTWDGSTLKMYINGTLYNQGTFSGNIDFNTQGNRGQWYVGAVPPGQGTTQAAPAIIQDIRVANVVRPQSYFANIYQQGFV